MRWVDLTSNHEQLMWFVNNVTSTGGGDSPECYELALLSWNKTNKQMINNNNLLNKKKRIPKQIYWREKTKDCKACGIKIYSVHCRSGDDSKEFYKTIAKDTGGVYLTLDEIQSFTGLMIAIIHREKDLSKKPEPSGEYKKEKSEFKERCEKLDSLTIEELKEMLKHNDQKVSGTKNELIKRIVDCQMYGCLPLCTLCGSGRLRVLYVNSKSYGHGGEGRFYCPGLTAFVVFYLLSAT
ncbi:hypothetical protein RFI_00250 [Reticulomyxa filosa]|uniref:SAP domain-containing protein n=1 Tax=Reticulomyxa filosa TaxID=46433 RepID=X6PGJ8_RETFI|nr:hypothetical protein RFI_00250 [Reticulomyxa filosa]|eukprot:ETO36812.1 hypothetical protein RFI_00250 [Reticulomyxa filosa]